MRNQFIILFFVLFGIFSCNQEDTHLPILGPREVLANGDTLYHKIPDFLFLNQYGDTVNQEYVKEKIYVADFFFTSCPTICPVMKSQMLRLQDKFKDTPQLLLLSHTIDPNHDSLSVLKKYREKLGVKGSQWQFLRADQQYVHDLAQKSYLVSALEDKEAIDDGGFIHSGAFVLVDKNRHIRGIFDGTKEKEVNKLIDAIENLLKEK